jgi:hypothetical protein
MLRIILLLSSFLTIAFFEARAQQTVKSTTKAKIHKMNFSEVARYELEHPPLLKKKQRAPNEDKVKVIINNTIDKSVPPFTGTETLVPVPKHRHLHGR